MELNLDTIAQSLSPLLGTGTSYPIMLRDDMGVKDTKPIAYRSSFVDLYNETPYVCLTKDAIREMSFLTPRIKWVNQELNKEDHGLGDLKVNYITTELDKEAPIRVGVLWGHLVPVISQQYTGKENSEYDETTQVCVIQGCKHVIDLPLSLQELSKQTAQGLFNKEELRHKLWHILENAPLATSEYLFSQLPVDLKSTTRLNPEYVTDEKRKPVICGLVFSHVLDMRTLSGHRLWTRLLTQFMNLLYELSIPEYLDPCELHLNPSRHIELSHSCHIPLQLIELGIKGLCNITGAVHSGINYDIDKGQYPPVMFKDVTAFDIECITNPETPLAESPTIHGTAATDAVVKALFTELNDFISDIKDNGSGVSFDGTVFNSGTVS